MRPPPGVSAEPGGLRQVLVLVADPVPARRPRAAGEWEFACRAGTTSRYWIGDKDEDLTQAAWFGANSGGRTHAVGELKGNPFGIYDIHGNVWEWVQDWWDPSYYTQFQGKYAVNPPGPPSSGNFWRMLRGGTWPYSASSSRSASCEVHDPVTRLNNLHHIGF